MHYKPHEFAKLVGVSVKTLQRWDNHGKLPAKRTPSNYRFYTDDDLRIALGEKPKPVVKKVVVYCRVSSESQLPELKDQVKAMEEFANHCGYSISETISEIGSGLNFKRKKFIEMIISMLKGEIEVIIVAHKDRLCRFAFDFIEQIANYSDCKIIVANQTNLSSQAELCDDLLAIVHSFSSRLYGLNSDSNNLNKYLNFPEAIDKSVKNEKECKIHEIKF